MEKYFFMKPLLGLLAQGRFFRKLTAMVLRVEAVMTVICCLVLILVLGKQILDLSITGKIGGIIFILLFVITIYMLVHTLLVRAGNIAGQAESDYNIVFIAFILTKLLGELAAIYIVFLSVGGGIFIWFAGADANYVLKEVFSRFPPVSEPFTSGLLVIIGGLTLAFFVLVLAYLLAELLLVFVSIALNTKKSRG